MCGKIGVSFRFQELPLRYADFGVLHRNEVQESCFFFLSFRCFIDAVLKKHLTSLIDV